MRIHAYVLAADPAFLVASVRSYYDRVDRIVVSYDESSTSWTGTPIPVEECLLALKELDGDGKCVLAPGDYGRPGYDPLDNDTHQRQAALAAASDGADWVLQLDTDEVMVDPDAFFGALGRAERAGAEALDYPSRWLYTRVADAGADAGAGAGRYLESSTRGWRSVAGYPGPLAVRTGTQLSLCRQADGARHYRVDLRPWNTDPAHPSHAVVHEVVPAESAVLHYSWVRSADAMRRKFGWSGHTGMYSEPAIYRRWAFRGRHPWLTVAATPWRRTGDRYRLVTLPDLGGPGDA